LKRSCLTNKEAKQKKRKKENKGKRGKRFLGRISPKKSKGKVKENGKSINKEHFSSSQKLFDFFFWFQSNGRETFRKHTKKTPITY